MGNGGNSGGQDGNLKTLQKMNQYRLRLLILVPIRPHNVRQHLPIVLLHPPNPSTRHYPLYLKNGCVLQDHYNSSNLTSDWPGKA